MTFEREAFQLICEFRKNNNLAHSIRLSCTSFSGACESYVSFFFFFQKTGNYIQTLFVNYCGKGCNKSAVKDP